MLIIIATRVYFYIAVRILQCVYIAFEIEFAILDLF